MLGLSNSISIGRGGKGPLWSGWSGLVSYWPLNETSGTRYDVVGTNHLTDVNTVGYATGKHGNAASFVAASNQILSHAALNAFSGDYTIAMWVKSSLLAGTYYFFSASGGPYLYWTNTTNSFTLIHGTGTVAVIDAAFDQWKLVIAWSASGILGLQVDTANNTVPAHTTPAETEFILGGVSGTGYLTGLLDEVSLFNVAKDAAWRTAMWNSGAGKFYPS